MGRKVGHVQHRDVRDWYGLTYNETFSLLFNLKTYRPHLVVAPVYDNKAMEELLSYIDEDFS